MIEKYVQTWTQNGVECGVQTSHATMECPDITPLVDEASATSDAESSDEVYLHPHHQQRQDSPNQQTVVITCHNLFCQYPVSLNTHSQPC